MKLVHTKIISVKFACNWPCGVGGDVVYRSVDGWTDRQMEARRTNSDYNSLP